MYKGRFFYIIFLLIQLTLIAQKEDYNWIMGYDGYANPDIDTGKIRLWGNTFMFFDGSKMDTFRYWHSLNFDKTNASISDEQGDLLFYTNGIKVYNKMHFLMENGDSLNFGDIITKWDPTIFRNGYRTPQGAMICKKPSSNNVYYLFHAKTTVDKNLSLFYPFDLLLTTIDLDYNKGIGKVISKNLPIFSDTISENLMLCKHGNGSDWWILVNKIGTNCFYALKIDSGGISEIPNMHCLGPSSLVGDITLSSYTPNGRKYITISASLGLTIYDFDRCTGMLSNPINIPRPELYPAVTGGIGVAVSPNSRYLYLCMYTKLYQFDLNAKDIPASKVFIDEYDGYTGDSLVLKYFPGGLPTVFHLAQLAPDGKIYISTGNGSRVLHVVNDPDKPGKTCNFKQHSFQLPTFSLGIPNFPNYRLGAMKCESEIVKIESSKIKLYPNPVKSNFIFDYGILDWSGDKMYSMSIFNTLGQTIFQKNLPMYSAFQDINCSQFPVGLYNITINNQYGVLWNGTMVKE